MRKQMTVRELGTGPVREGGKPAPAVKRKVAGDREAEARRLREESTREISREHEGP